MTQDFNPYIVIDEAAFFQLLQVVELAEAMAKEQYTHLLSEIESASVKSQTTLASSSARKMCRSALLMPASTHD